MNFTLKGQGALEYLLLIGGGVVIAAIVVYLILNIGGTNSAQSEMVSTGSTCGKLALSAANTTPICGDVNAQSGSQSKIKNMKTRTCYQCAGTYPSCYATETTGTFESAGNCLGSDSDFAIIQ